MEIKTLMLVFTAVFIAELGDKTQLATLAFAGAAKSKWSVFIGSSLALVAASALATLLGAVISKYIPPVYLSRVAGVTFLVFGAMYLIRP